MQAAGVGAGAGVWRSGGRIEVAGPIYCVGMYFAIADWSWLAVFALSAILHWFKGKED